MTCVGGPEIGVTVKVAAGLTVKAGSETIELVELGYTITKSLPEAVPLGTVSVVPEGIAPPALEVKLPVVPETHVTVVELVLRQSL